jgi:hypothetical protein
MEDEERDRSGEEGDRSEGEDDNGETGDKVVRAEPEEQAEEEVREDIDRAFD